METSKRRRNRTLTPNDTHSFTKNQIKTTVTHSLKIIALLSLSCLAAISTYADEDDTPLGKEMSGMNKPFRSLSKEFRSEPNPDNRAEYISQAEAMLEHAKASVDYVPALADTLAPEAKAEMVAAYKVEMQKTVTTIEQLVTALKSNDDDEAKQLIAELKKQKSAGHKKFKKKDD
jgi:hypothetical protein